MRIFGHIDIWNLPLHPPMVRNWVFKMKTEAKIRAYISALKKDEEIARDLIRSPNIDDKKKEHWFEVIQYLQRMRNALEWVLDE